MIRFYNEIKDQLKLLDRLTDEHHVDPSLANEGHKKIAQAIENKDARLAIREMHKHIYEVITSLQNYILKYNSKKELDNIEINEIV